nr:MAG TPA: hypothetical protein [Caudoviricetes sp.]
MARVVSLSQVFRRVFVLCGRVKSSHSRFSLRPAVCRSSLMWVM